MATSGTYNSLSPKSAELIREAYRYVIKVPDVLTLDQIQSAQNSINLIFSSWYNEGWNIWTTKRRILGIYQGQNTYTLPTITQEVIFAAIRTSERQLSGTADSSSGVAQNAFDGNPLTACQQNDPDGDISYQWDNQRLVQMVGVQSNATLDYELTLDYSNDGGNWTTVYTVPSQTYNQGIVYWFNIESPSLGTYFRIKEIGGETLDIQELYFNLNLNDTVMTGVSSFDYDAIPNKNQQGKPSSYFFNRQITPTISLWLTPNEEYNAVYYTAVEAIQDIGDLVDNPEIPARFLLPLTDALAYRISIKEQVPNDRVALLKSISDETFAKASGRDIENVSLKISTNQSLFS